MWYKIWFSIEIEACIERKRQSLKIIYTFKFQKNFREHYQINIEACLDGSWTTP